jgi:4-hydroxybenzoate polyprenyltransferase
LFKKLRSTFFYGNYFYGICTLALTVEASFQQQVHLNSLVFYLFLFIATVVYYTHAYIGVTVSDRFYNKRSAWYTQHKKNIRIKQVTFVIAGCVTIIYFLQKNLKEVLHLSFQQWILLFVFPFTAVLYYGIVLSPRLKLNLRRSGWLKPFVVGFVWAGVVTLYPVIFHQIETGTHTIISLFGGWLFLKNWMFITVLCIMFDIKDYAADHNHQLKTFVVQVGLRKTIFYIIIPLSLIGLASFILFAWANHFPLLRILINLIPFLLLIIVAYSLHQRKSILYYLAVIDGLMLVKAVCGVLGVLLIK